MPIIKTENGYIYKKITKRTGFSKAVFILILFFVSVCVVAGSFFVFSKFDVTSALNLNKYLVFEEKSYYAISLASADSFSSLSKMADEVKLRDGAGFVLKSGEKYYLLANVYNSLDDANSVASQLKTQTVEYDIEVLQIKLSRIVISSSFEMKQILLIKDALSLVDIAQQTLFEIVLALDRAELMPAEALNKLEVFKKTCREAKETFANSFQNISENIITNVKIFQSEVISDLTVLSASKNLSSDIKFAVLQIISNFVTLQNNILK